MPFQFSRSLGALALPLVWGICSPWGAHAQVAVPTLIPVTPGINGSPGVLSAGFVTLNPAAMQWGAPSRVGLGAAEASFDPEGSRHTDYYVRFGGARLVGQRLSIAGEGLSLQDRTGPLDFATETRAGALGARVFSPLVIGLGYSNQEDREGQFQTELTTWSAGASYRFGEWLYLGAAYGEDQLDIKEGPGSFPPVGFDGNRAFRMLGAGIRVGGRLRAHLEVYRVDRDEFKDAGGGFSDLQSQAGVLEIGLGALVLGFKAISVDQDLNGRRYKSDVRVYDVALAPLLGLAIGVHVERSAEEDEGTGVESIDRLTALTLAYQF